MVDDFGICDCRLTSGTIVTWIRAFIDEMLLPEFDEGSLSQFSIVFTVCPVLVSKIRAETLPLHQSHHLGFQFI